MPFLPIQAILIGRLLPSFLHSVVIVIVIRSILRSERVDFAHHIVREGEVVAVRHAREAAHLAHFIHDLSRAAVVVNRERLKQLILRRSAPEEVDGVRQREDGELVLAPEILCGVGVSLLEVSRSLEEEVVVAVDIDPARVVVDHLQVRGAAAASGGGVVGAREREPEDHAVGVADGVVVKARDMESHLFGEGAGGGEAEGLDDVVGVGDGAVLLADGGGFAGDGAGHAEEDEGLEGQLAGDGGSDCVGDGRGGGGRVGARDVGDVEDVRRRVGGGDGTDVALVEGEAIEGRRDAFSVRVLVVFDEVGVGMALLAGLGVVEVSHGGRLAGLRWYCEEERSFKTTPVESFW